jgi:hypothetical protein
MPATTVDWHNAKPPRYQVAAVIIISDHGTFSSGTPGGHYTRMKYFALLQFGAVGNF